MRIPVSTRLLLGAWLGAVTCLTIVAAPVYSDGLIGAPISGNARVHGEKFSPARVEGMLELGVDGDRPYALRRFVIAPTVTRTDAQCQVDVGFAIEGLKTEGPGGLGEIVWGIDIGDHDGGVVKEVSFIFATQGGGQRVVVAKGAGNRWAVDLAKDAIMPDDVTVKIKWFDAEAMYTFPLTKAIYASSKTDAADAGEAPKPRAAAAPGASNAKGTHLTFKALGDAPQPLPGYWKINYTLVDETPMFARFDMSASPTLISLLNATDANKSYGWLQWTGDQWRGKVYIVSNDKECRDKGYMQPAAAKASADNMRFEGEWRGRSIGEDCKLTEEPGSGALRWERYVGSTFLPLKPGKYIYTIAAPAVGPNPAQYKAMVKLGWNHAPVGAKKVRLVYGPQIETKWDIDSPDFNPEKLTPAELEKLEDDAFVAALRAKLQRTTKVYEGPAGEFEFVTDQPGEYQFDVQVLGKDDAILHVDHLIAEIPTERELLGR